MRKKQREQLLEVVDTIKEAQGHIRELLESERYEEAGALLADCQNGAIAAGSAMESLPEDTSPLIAELEGYCELVYEASRRMEEGNGADQILKTSMGALDRIHHSLRHDIKTDYEIVFLPYKASMWDSMESVWKEFSKDGSCHCHVIAIPYYDRHPDGSFGELHIEKNDFPEYVEMTDYRDYSIQERQPDVIFIHNPYDNSNYVTSVHPDYYSSNLKDQTGLLVYIPYFITSNVCEEHYCTLPGVVYSDITVVQSETIRQMYINSLRKAFELDEQQVQKLGLERKIIALGSPKIDKVVNTQASVAELPVEWKKRVIMPDGKVKKIILYNTGVDSLIKNGERELKKIEEVFQIFRKHREAVLWWRPHPLTEATIESMRPDLYEKYKELVRLFLENNIGILDDTPNLNRSIILSDAYYGDGSSLIGLYMMTGKPVLISRVKPAENKGIQLQIRDFVIYDNKAWFISNNMNYLLRLDMDTGELELIGEIPGERAFEKDLSYTARRMGDMLVLIPAKCSYIVLYDLRSGCFRCRYAGSNEKVKYLCSAAEGDFLYLFPLFEKEIIKYNMKTDSVEKRTELESETQLPKCRRRVLKDQDGIYFVTGNDNRVFRYDLKDDTVSWHRAGRKERKLYEIEKYNGTFFLVSDDEILLTGGGTWEEEAVIGFPKEYRRTGRSPFIDTVRFGNLWYLIPDYSDMILKIDLEKRTAECFLDCLEREKGPEERLAFPRYSSACGIDGMIYAVSNYEGCFQLINTYNGQIKNIPLRLSEEQQRFLMDRPLFACKRKEGEDIFSFFETESDIFTLEKYIEAVITEADGMKDTAYKAVYNFFADTKGTCGKKIYAMIRNYLEGPVN